MCSVVCRYGREVDGKERSMLRRVTERAESAAAMVLFVAQVLPATHTLTDGW